LIGRKISPVGWRKVLKNKIKRMGMEKRVAGMCLQPFVMAGRRWKIEAADPGYSGSIQFIPIFID